MYHQKYLKYKKKYFNLKEQIGSAPLENLIIPNNVKIEYDNIKPPHEIPMYYVMTQIYLGLAPKFVEPRNTPQDLKKNVTTSIHNNNCSQLPNNNSYKCTFNICDSTREFTITKKDFFLNTYHDCFIKGCGDNMTLLEHENLLVIFSPVGVVVKNDSFLKDEEESTINLLFKLIDYIKERGKKQILLCGHSNGFTSSVKLSYILLILSGKIRNFTNVVGFTGRFARRLSVYRSNNFQSYFKNIDIFVVGTGGFPVLFSSEVGFKEYYELMNGRYLHLVSGFSKNYVEQEFSKSKNDIFNEVIKVKSNIDDDKFSNLKNKFYFLKNIKNIIEFANYRVSEQVISDSEKMILKNLFFRLILKIFDDHFFNGRDDIIDFEKYKDNLNYKLESLQRDSKNNLQNESIKYNIDFLNGIDIKHYFPREEQIDYIKDSVEKIKKNNNRIEIYFEYSNNILDSLIKLLDGEIYRFGVLTNILTVFNKLTEEFFNNNKNKISEITNLVDEYYTSPIILIDNLSDSITKFKSNTIFRHHPHLDYLEKINSDNFLDSNISDIKISEDKTLSNFKFYVYDYDYKSDANYEKSYCYRDCFINKRHNNNDIEFDANFLHNYEHYRNILSGYFLEQNEFI